MRPVDRGEAPREYSKYEEAKGDLVLRLGLFCSYCERPIKTLLAVEHVLPKSLYPEFKTAWSNFVLGCTNCNSTKGNRDVNRSEVILPDQDNAFRAFVYAPEGTVRPNVTLSNAVQEKAARTLWLTGLDKFPDEFEEEADQIAALERWQQRSLAWREAGDQWRQLQSYDTGPLRKTIARLALATGFFSVWMAVFREDADMRRRFIEVFPGTARDCFDPVTTVEISRSGGHC